MPDPVAVAPPGSALVRVRIAAGVAGLAGLPATPDGTVLTVTLGHAELADVADELGRRGYRVVGIAADHRPLGSIADVLVPAEVRESSPRWWAELTAGADRVFDPTFGPVARVLGPELDLHLRAAADRTPAGGR